MECLPLALSPRLWMCAVSVLCACDESHILSVRLLVRYVVCEFYDSGRHTHTRTRSKRKECSRSLFLWLRRNECQIMFRFANERGAVAVAIGSWELMMMVVVVVWSHFSYHSDWTFWTDRMTFLAFFVRKILPSKLLNWRFNRRILDDVNGRNSRFPFTSPNYMNLYHVFSLVPLPACHTAGCAWGICIL